MCSANEVQLSYCVPWKYKSGDYGAVQVEKTGSEVAVVTLYFSLGLLSIQLPAKK